MSSYRRFVFLCLAQLSVCASLAAAPTAPANQTAPANNQLGSGDTVVAKQGSAVVTLSDIDAFAKKINEKQRAGFFDNPQRLETLISNLLVQRQLAAEAEKAGLDKDPSVEAQVKLATEEVLSKNLMERLRSDVKLPNFDQLAREEYLGHKEKYVKRGTLDVKHILISTDKHTDAQAKELADQVRNEALAHPDQFDTLVEKYSEDHSKAQNHGLMADARSNHYVTPFSSAASALKVPGEISPVIKTQFGYHILKLVARTSDEPQSFEKVRASIVGQLRSSYLEKAVSDHVDQLRNQHIDANPDVVASLRDRYDSGPADPDAATAEHGAQTPR